MAPQSARPEAANAPSADPEEVAKFERLAAEWWDGSGRMRPLHVMNPARLAILREILARHFDRDIKAKQPLGGLAVLDLGCGGGLVAEPLARMGAAVMGVDASPELVGVASAHAGRMGIAIDYRAGGHEMLLAEGRSFDAVLALELLEHVADPGALVGKVAGLVKPGGAFIVSTINRTLASLALAKFAAERVLRWVEPGTHEYRKFLRPQQLRYAFEAAGLEPRPPIGLSYRPLKDDWTKSLDVSVNYIMWASKP